MPEAKRAGLPGRAAAAKGGEHVVVLGELQRLQRLGDDLLVNLVGEVLGQRRGR